MNFPNSLTVMRIILGLALPFLLVYGTTSVQIIACFIFVFGTFTDWLDGWYARKYKLVTTLGKILDPIADKIMVLGSFITFAVLGMYSIWLIIPIALRELVITVYRLIFLRDKKVVAAAQSGKIKTAVQMATLGFLYIYFIYRKIYLGEETFREWLMPDGLMYFLLFLSVVLTLYSGYQFFTKNWKLVKNTTIKMMSDF